MKDPARPKIAVRPEIAGPSLGVQGNDFMSGPRGAGATGILTQRIVEAGRRRANCPNIRDEKKSTPSLFFSPFGWPLLSERLGRLPGSEKAGDGRSGPTVGGWTR